MKLHTVDIPEQTAEVHVLHGKVGHRYDSIELDSRDVWHLLEMSPERIRGWLEHMQTGFPPRR